MSTIEFKVLAVTESSIENLFSAEARSGGLTLTQENNTRSAWKAVETGRPELLILSLDFERMAGEIFLRKFMKDDLFGKIPVIVMATALDREKLALCQELGIKDILTAPFGPKKIMDCVEKFYRKKVIQEVSRI